jgi:hypothetical protein
MQKTGAKVANPTLSSLTASDLERWEAGGEPIRQ